MTDTNVVIHCPSCGVRLNVPPDAAGRWARCPGCKQNFQVPQPKDMLDDMVTCWMGLDEMDDEQHAQDLARAEALRVQADDPATTVDDRSHPPIEPTHADEDDRAAQSAESNRAAEAAKAHAQARSKPAAAPPTGQSLRRRDRASGGATAQPSNRFGATKPDGAEPATDSPDQAAPAGASTEAPAGPSTGATTGGMPSDTPRLRVMKITSGGVRFSFPSKLLNNDLFRASMPMCDIFTGERGEGVEFTARPFAWINRGGGGAGKNAGEIEALYEIHPRTGQLPIDVVRSMRTMDELPPPFSSPMPYYIAQHTSGKSSVHCESFHTPHGIFCEVVVPSAPVALEWLMRVNGVCCDEFVELEQQVRKLESTAWQAIPEKVRNRLVVWFDFVANERFLAYFNDGDFSGADAGLSGLIVTDQRLVYCKFHSHGSIAHAEPGTLVAVQSGRFSTLTLRRDTKDKRIVKLRNDDVSELAVLLDEVDSKLDLIAEQGPEPKPPAPDESDEGADG